MLRSVRSLFPLAGASRLTTNSPKHGSLVGSGFWVSLASWSLLQDPFNSAFLEMSAFQPVVEGTRKTALECQLDDSSPELSKLFEMLVS